MYVNSVDPTALLSVVELLTMKIKMISTWTMIKVV